MTTTDNIPAGPLPKLPTYIGHCCRDWDLAPGYHGRCGLCGELPGRPDAAYGSDA